MRKSSIILTLALLFTLNASAQTQSYRQQVNALLDNFHFDGIMENGFSAGFEENRVSITNFSQFINELMKEIKPYCQKIVAEKIYGTVSESDLIEFNKVLRTPVGQKLVKQGLKEGGVNLPDSENIVLSDDDYLAISKIAPAGFSDKFEKTMDIIGTTFEEIGTNEELQNKMTKIILKYMK